VNDDHAAQHSIASHVKQPFRDWVPAFNAFEQDKPMLLLLG
jgi:hypothetical protein